jgi:hypothetical protein
LTDVHDFGFGIVFTHISILGALLRKCPVAAATRQRVL